MSRATTSSSGDRARNRGNGSPEAADVRRGVLVGLPAAQAPLRVRRMLELRGRMPWIVEAEDDRARTLPGEVPTCGSSPFTTRIASAGSSRAVSATAPQGARARRSDRVGPEEIPQADGPRTGPPRDFGQGSLVHLEQAELGAFAARSVDVTPDTRLAPDALWARRTRGERISLTMAAVVVLPFVADTSTNRGEDDARGGRGARIDGRDHFSRHVVPPPAPTSRERRAAARAAVIPTGGGRARSPRERSRGGAEDPWNE